MTCTKEVWQDVFITKEAYGGDDEFVMNVQTVDIPSNKTDLAVVVPYDTRYIMELFPGTSSHTPLQVGDTISVRSKDAITHHLQIVNRHKVTALASGIDLQVGTYDANFDLPILDTTPVTRRKTLPSRPYYYNPTFKVNGQSYDGTTYTGVTETLTDFIVSIDEYVYEVSKPFNCTVPPYKVTNQHSNQLGIPYYDSVSNMSAAQYAKEYLISRDLFKPHAQLYKTILWKQNTEPVLSARLEGNVKGVSCIKLMGYQMSRVKEFKHDGHLKHMDDFMICEVDDVQGRIVSNNHFAHGAFAVLSLGADNYDTENTRELHAFDAHGLFNHYFSPINTQLRMLTIRLLDRQGNPAHIGRLHLWFKVLVVHG